MPKTMNIHDLFNIPLPKKHNILFVCGTATGGYINHFSHDDISFFFTVLLGCFGIISYSYKFIKWIFNNNKN